MKCVSCILLFILILNSCQKKNTVQYLINTETMTPCVNPGDYVVEDPSETNFNYGDIIRYEYQGDPIYEAFSDVYRIVGLPGDEISVKNSIVTVNGETNRSEYLDKNSLYDIIQEEMPNGVKIIIHHYHIARRTDQGTIKVPYDCYFVMGDSRSRAVDSRYFGPIRADKIKSKIVGIKRSKKNKVYVPEK